MVQSRSYRERIAEQAFRDTGKSKKKCLALTREILLQVSRSIQNQLSGREQADYVFVAATLKMWYDALLSEMSEQDARFVEAVTKAFRIGIAENGIQVSGAGSTVIK